MSSNSTHTGSITLDFKSERTFRTFGYQWAQCNAHLQVKGEIKKPAETGRWQYDVPYKFDCGCETVLGEFHRAYEGAFNKKLGVRSVHVGPYSYDDLPLQVLESDDYVATLNSCGMPDHGGRDASVEDATFWNIGFTEMIRKTNGAAWGNWNLNPAIVPGAVGILDPETGSFTQSSTLPKAVITKLKSPEDWVIESSSVHRTESDVDFKGGYIDPSTGTKVDVGLDVSWSFSSEGSLVSNATITGLSQVDDFATAMANNYDWFLQKAKDAGYATDDGIVQGFGMITVVQNCAGGINIGSLTEDSSFSLVGSVDGVNAMTGGGDINVGVKGSYKETNQTKSFESHMWPAEANSAAAGEVGISYQFASFDGKQLMPTWIKKLSGFAVTFDNQHGGTYIAHCEVTYDQMVNNVKQSSSKTASVSGGHTQTLDGIPLDAINLQINVHFVDGGDFHGGFRKPLTALLAGSCTVDLSGVWPWGSHASLRIAT